MLALHSYINAKYISPSLIVTSVELKHNSLIWKSSLITTAVTELDTMQLFIHLQ